MEDVVSRTFWKGRRVFVTGHTGFKGGWLSLWLQKLGASVYGYALAPDASPSLFTAARVADGMESIIGDIRDAQSFSQAVQKSQSEIVFHMAAQPLVRRSYADPVETYSTNVMGLVNLLETIRMSTTVKAVVNVTSDKCYENREWIWAYRENDPMGGFDPYSSSKGCAEIVTAAYRRSFLEKQGIGLASARAGNVIGGGDWATDRLVPDILRALSVGKCAEIRNPSAIRPWQHVLEPLSGYLRLAECLYEDHKSYSEGWNFGPSAEQNCSVGQLASQLVAIWGNRASWSASEQTGPHEANLLSLDCTKARQKLMWRPRWEIGETLDKIVQWQSAYLRGADMHDFTLSQIGEYQARKEKHE